MMAGGERRREGEVASALYYDQVWRRRETRYGAGQFAFVIT